MGEHGEQLGGFARVGYEEDCVILLFGVGQMSVTRFSGAREEE